MAIETDMLGFMGFLAGLEAKTREQNGRDIMAAARLIQKQSKGMLGEYQAGTDQFDAWRDLADVTKELRDRWGYPENEPELVTGELRAHILTAGPEHHTDGVEAAVGVPSVLVGDHNDDDGDPHTRERDIGEVAVAQELGIGMPPRSFLGLGAAKVAERVAEMLGHNFTMVLCGREPDINVKIDAEAEHD